MSDNFDAAQGIGGSNIANELEQFNQTELRKALQRVGQILAEKNQSIEVAVTGGAVALLYFENRITTRDVDAIFPKDPLQKKILKDAIHQVGKELNFKQSIASDWMNNDFEVVGFKSTPEAVVFQEGGLTMKTAAFEELLAIKLCTWRNKNDTGDAKAIMKGLLEKYADDTEGLFEKVKKYKTFGVSIKPVILRERFDKIYDAVAKPSHHTERELDEDIAYSMR